MKWLASAALLATLAGARGVEPAMLPPVTELNSREVLPKVFQLATAKKPLEIRSEQDAAKYLSDKEVAVLAKQVDFKQQVVLLFAWQGSSGDKLNYAIAESFPEQVLFSLQGGRTKDLRVHVRFFALRNNVKWKAD